MPFLTFIAVGIVLSFLSLFIPFPVGILLSNIGLVFFNPLTVLAMVGVYFLLGNIAKLIVFRHHLRFDLFRDLLPGSILGGLIITYLLTFLAEKIIIGVILFFAFLYVFKNLFSRKKNKPEAPEQTRTSGFLAGLSTGMLSAIGGPGGTLRGAYVANHVTSLQELNGVTASISLVTSVTNTLLRAHSWDISWNFVFPFLFAFPVLLAITFLGKAVIDRLNLPPRTIKLITNGAVLVSLIYALPILFH